jgi:hypothetical protein
MPGCVLRVQSATNQLDDLVEASGLTPIIVHRKGQPRVPGASSRSAASGFNVDVSGADDGIDTQVGDAIRFLKRHDAGLRRLRRCKAFGGMTLDFGLYSRSTKERPWPSYRLPADLIQQAGKHRIEIELSFYGPLGETRTLARPNRTRR